MAGCKDLIDMVLTLASRKESSIQRFLNNIVIRQMTAFAVCVLFSRYKVKKQAAARETRISFSAQIYQRFNDIDVK